MTKNGVWDEFVRLGSAERRAFLAALSTEELIELSRAACALFNDVGTALDENR